MKLIHFQGLNCYHDCMITLANAFGLDYTEAFSRLWAESRLRYDPICSVFLSQRLEKTLDSFGMKLNAPWVTEKERETGWADIPASHYVIIGIDAFLIPWSPLYKVLHGPHYFIIQKGTSESHDCFDPTYGLSGQKLTAQELIFNSYALIAVKPDSTAIPIVADICDPLLEQANEVLKSHRAAISHFLEQAAIWIQESKDTVFLPAKYIDALLTGRYLFRYFLKARDNSAERAPLFFSQQYYEDWLTVKNGFYKAALVRQNSSAFEEACHLLTRLTEQELLLAKQISSTES